jgi:hypothetical protein
LSDYAYIYNLGPQVVAVGADVLFDTNGILSGITHVPSSSLITVTTSGVYKVTFSVSAVEPNQMALALNGVVVPGTTYGSGAGTQQNTGQATIQLSPGDVLTLRNAGSPIAVTLPTLTGGFTPNVNASLTIEKLA